ncbi:MAG: hypothetical protein Q9173_004479, partial [Seirophora scorigena]
MTFIPQEKYLTLHNPLDPSSSSPNTQKILLPTTTSIIFLYAFPYAPTNNDNTKSLRRMANQQHPSSSSSSSPYPYPPPLHPTPYKMDSQRPYSNSGDPNNNQHIHPTSTPSAGPPHPSSPLLNPSSPSITNGENNFTTTSSLPFQRNNNIADGAGAEAEAEAEAEATTARMHAAAHLARARDRLVQDMQAQGLIREVEPQQQQQLLQPRGGEGMG